MDVKDVKKGMLVAESDYGMTVVCEATCDAVRVEGRMGSADGWEVFAVVKCGDGVAGEPVRWFSADEFSAYAPDLELVAKPKETP